nr:GFA family protein [uncultured Lichenicoccus sp.]
MDEAASHSGGCFCGAVALEVSGAPEGMRYCHCRSCQSWSGGPLNAFTLWRPDAVRITSGAEHVGTFQKTEFTRRKYCTRCGGHLMSQHPTVELVDVFASTIPTLPFAAGVHGNYADSVLPMHDGLPKFRDFPAELRGSGETLPK